MHLLSGAISFRSVLFFLSSNFGRGKKMKNMGISCLLIIAAASFLLSASLATAEPWNHARKDVIHVGGKVVCQDCTQGWNEWVNGAKPLKGCKVSVMCRDLRHRVIYYGSDLTDETGVYEIIINKYVNGKELDPKNCFVRLVSSPDPVCNIATDFAGGKSGVKLHRPTEVYRDLVKYVMGTFYYTTPMCDEPDTSNTEEQPDTSTHGSSENESEDSKESNY